MARGMEIERQSKHICSAQVQRGWELDWETSSMKGLKASQEVGEMNRLLFVPQMAKH